MSKGSWTEGGNASEFLSNQDYATLLQAAKQGGKSVAGFKHLEEWPTDFEDYANQLVIIHNPNLESRKKFKRSRDAVPWKSPRGWKVIKHDSRRVMVQYRTRSDNAYRYRMFCFYQHGVRNGRRYAKDEGEVEEDDDEEEDGKKKRGRGRREDNHDKDDRDESILLLHVISPDVPDKPVSRRNRVSPMRTRGNRRNDEYVYGEDDSDDGAYIRSEEHGEEAEEEDVQDMEEEAADSEEHSSPRDLETTPSEHWDIPPVNRDASWECAPQATSPDYLQESLQAYMHAPGARPYSFTDHDYVWMHRAYEEPPADDTAMSRSAPPAFTPSFHFGGTRHSRPDFGAPMHHHTFNPHATSPAMLVPPAFGPGFGGRTESGEDLAQPPQADFFGFVDETVFPETPVHMDVAYDDVQDGGFETPYTPRTAAANCGIGDFEPDENFCHASQPAFTQHIFGSNAGNGG